MIIPIKCFTCGKVLADKYLWFVKMMDLEKNKKQQVKRQQNTLQEEMYNDTSELSQESKAEPIFTMDFSKTNDSRQEYLTLETLGQKSIRGHLLDQLSLRAACCRRHMLTHVDIL